MDYWRLLASNGFGATSVAGYGQKYFSGQRDLHLMGVREVDDAYGKTVGIHAAVGFFWKNQRREMVDPELQDTAAHELRHALMGNGEGTHDGSRFDIGMGGRAPKDIANRHFSPQDAQELRQSGVPRQ